MPVSNSSNYTAIFSAIELKQQTAIVQRQRSLVIMSGSASWCRQLATQWLQRQAYQRPLWVGDNGPEDCWQLPSVKCRQLLGSEVDSLIYDGWQGLDPDALAAVSGALKGGGLLILLTPPMAGWPSFTDPDYQRLLVHPYPIESIKGRFIRFFQRQLLQDKSTLLIEQGQDIQPGATDNKKLPAQSISPTSAQLPGGCITDNQLAAVTAIKKVATGHTRRPLVITADRGRGKSSALGIACGQLLQQGLKTIIITAPRADAVQALFQRAAAILTPEQSQPFQPQLVLQFNHACIQFVAADELLRNQPRADLLLVDEAAAIPVPMLTKMLQSYNRLVFSSTVHGYEGTGRGFQIRFRQVLDKLTPQWKSLQLSQPIRWADNDPLERCLFNALLLNAGDESQKIDKPLSVGQCVTEIVDRDQLMLDEESLKSLFGLLLVAHYQTTSSDLRNLLDGPNISIWVSRYRGKIVAAAIVSREGGFDDELAMDVWKNQRRPRGHLIPQTLAGHMGLQQAPQLRYLRVMRIAVQPAVQRRGLAKQLMAAITAQSRVDGIDFVGSSFAATADVLAFWRSVQCLPVKLGVSLDTCSGSYSAVLLSALSTEAADLLTLARQRFNQSFSADLLRRYQQLDVAVVEQLLLAEEKLSKPQLDQQDWLDIEAFAHAYRDYEMVIQPLVRLICLAFAKQTVQQCLTDAERGLLIRRVLQNQPMEQLISVLGLSGKKALAKATRGAVAVLVENYRGVLGW